MLDVTRVSDATLRFSSVVDRLRDRAGQTPESDEAPTRTDRLSDRVDLSPIRPAETGADQAAVLERIRALRERIADGTYVTADKLAVVADRLHDELFRS